MLGLPPARIFNNRETFLMVRPASDHVHTGACAPTLVCLRTYISAGKTSVSPSVCLRRPPTCCMASWLNKYIRPKKNTFVRLPLVNVNYLTWKPGRERWLTGAGDVAGEEKDGEGWRMEDGGWRGGWGGPDGQRWHRARGSRYKGEG